MRTALTRWREKWITHQQPPFCRDSVVECGGRGARRKPFAPTTPERQGKEKRWDEEGHGFYLAWLRLSLNKPTTTNPTPRDVKTGWTLFGPLMAVIKVPDPMPNMRAPHVDVVKKNRLLITFPLSSARG
jgi:hypothetical protein